jgi:hypothetical protein
VRLVRQHEQQRRDDVRRLMQHDFPLGERFADQPELELLQIAQTAVDQLRAPLRSRRSEIAFLDDQNGETPSGSVARDTGTVYAGATTRRSYRESGARMRGRSTGFSDHSSVAHCAAWPAYPPLRYHRGFLHTDSQELP